MNFLEALDAIVAKRRGPWTVLNSQLVSSFQGIRVGKGCGRQNDCKHIHNPLGIEQKTCTLAFGLPLARDRCAIPIRLLDIE